jgi:cell division protein FtsZ
VPDTWQLGIGEERARVAVVGCGGAGCNILRHVTAPPNAIRIAVNDAVHPSMAEVPSRVLVPAISLQAYASMDERAVRTMETDEEKKISAVLLDRDVVLILGGLGGELGGWGMSLVGRVARILGDATLAFATVPFTIEGPIRRQLAEAQLRLLQKRVDGVVTFNNDGLLQIARDVPLAKAFAALGAIMARAASGLSSALGRSDVTPLQRMLVRVHEWRFGMGAGREMHRCFLAVDEAYKSPWFASLPEEVSHAVVLMSVPEPGKDDAEILRQIRLRSPHAVLAWASGPQPNEEERAIVQILAGT